MALQIDPQLIGNLSNFGRQPAQQLRQGLLTPVQMAPQDLLAKNIVGMFGGDTRTAAEIELAKLKEAEQMASLEQFGQQASQKAYALREAAGLGDVGRDLIKQRDVGLMSDADLVKNVEGVKQSRRDVEINKALLAYEKALKAGDTKRADSLENLLVSAGVDVAKLDERRKAAISEDARVAPPTLVNQLQSLAAAGDTIAQSYLENVSGAAPSETAINSALTYIKGQNKPQDVAYLKPEAFASADGLAEAQQTALMNNDVGVAAQLGQMREQMLANEVNLNAADVVEIASAVNPNYKDIKQRQLSLGQAKELLMLPGAAGSAELARRSISDIQRSDAKSLEAMRQFARSASIDQRVRDSLNMFVNGEFSDATKQDYINIADKLTQYYSNEINQTALQLLQSGNKEDAAAGTALLRINTPGGIKFLD